MEQELKYQQMTNTLQFRCLMGIETEKEVILPDEETKQIPKTVTREDAIRRATQIVLKQIKK